MKLLHTLLPQDHPWGKTIHYYDTLPSTNTLAKELARKGAPEGTVILAGHQTGGRGRMGRSFSSPEGMGLYLSLILRPECPPERLMHLTCAAGLAAREAVKDTAGVLPGIKWANDLVIGKGKLGGILTELGFDHQGSAAWAVIGIGINCRQGRQDFPEDISAIATSLALETGKDIAPLELAADLILRLEEMNRNLLCPGPTMTRYRSACVTLGQEVCVVQAGQAAHGKALSIDDSGALTVEYPDGSRETVTYGEVSIRGMYGYA